MQQRDTHSAGQSGGDTGILTLTICPLGSDHSIFQSFPQIPILDGDDAGVPPLIRSIKPIIQQPLPPHQSHWEGIKFTGDACYQRNLVETFYSRELWLVFKPYAFSYIRETEQYLSTQLDGSEQSLWQFDKLSHF